MVGCFHVLVTCSALLGSKEECQNKLISREAIQKRYTSGCDQLMHNIQSSLVYDEEQDKKAIKYYISNELITFMAVLGG